MAKEDKTKAIESAKRYDIVRFHRGGRNKVLHRGVSLDVARLHTNDPRTKKEGKWFDGYRESRH